MHRWALILTADLRAGGRPRRLQGTATRWRHRVLARGGEAAAEPERYVGARTARSRGPATPDGVAGLDLGRDPAREGADRSVRPPRPARHNQRGLRRPPVGEYARCGGHTPERRPRPPLRSGTRAARMRRGARVGGARRLRGLRSSGGKMAVG